MTIFDHAGRFAGLLTLLVELHGRKLQNTRVHIFISHRCFFLKFWIIQLFASDLLPEWMWFQTAEVEALYE